MVVNNQKVGLPFLIDTNLIDSSIIGATSNAANAKPKNNLAVLFIIKHIKSNPNE